VIYGFGCGLYSEEMCLSLWLGGLRDVTRVRCAWAVGWGLRGSKIEDGREGCYRGPDKFGVGIAILDMNRFDDWDIEE
jgi:hypothetical protein